MSDGRYHANYIGFFERFNEQRFFEAHEVLEVLWLPSRQATEASFYKGLIQLAGAFVHLQKARPDPATRLLKLARGNLLRYPPVYEGLALAEVLRLIDHWLMGIDCSATERLKLTPATAPRLCLLESSELRTREQEEA